MALVAWLGVGVAPHWGGSRGLRGTEARDDRSIERLAMDAPPARAAPVAAELRCTFLDVGHGTSVVIEMPTGEVWLYDAGHMGSSERSHEGIAAALWTLPTARIDTLVISHADADHYNATRGLAERFTIGRIASTPQFWSSDDRNVRELVAHLRDRGAAMHSVAAPAEGRMGEVSWRIVHPSAVWQGESDNASSLCLVLEYHGKRVLLPGDLEGSGLTGLVELPERPCHVLMAPHHGSLTLDPSELLAWCRPDVVVISGNHRAMRPEVLAKYHVPGAAIGITFRDGAIQTRIDDHGRLSSWHWDGSGWAMLGQSVE